MDTLDDLINKGIKVNFEISLDFQTIAIGLAGLGLVIVAAGLIIKKV